MGLRILVVEDEQIIAARLTRLISEILGHRLDQLEVVASLTEAEQYLDGNQVDLVFLDLNLKGKDGFELLKGAVAGAHQTVIVSAHGDRALEAFEYGVLDFIGKPFNRERLELAITRYFEGHRNQTATTRYLAIKRGGDTQLIPLEQVVFIRGAGTYSELVLGDERTCLHNKSLEKLERLLPVHWQRIHKSYLIDMNRVTSWHASAGSKYEVTLDDDTRLPVGRTRYKELRAQWL